MCICMYVWMYVWKYVCIYECICACMYGSPSLTHTRTQIHRYTGTQAHTYIFDHSPIHSLTHALTHSRTHSRTHLLTHSLSLSLSFSHSRTSLSLTHIYTLSFDLLPCSSLLSLFLPSPVVINRVSQFPNLESTWI